MQPHGRESLMHRYTLYNSLHYTSVKMDAQQADPSDVRFVILKLRHDSAQLPRGKIEKENGGVSDACSIGSGERF